MTRKYDVKPTGVERFFGENELIVSKTNTKGLITYANDIFLRLAGFREEEVINQPHNLIRHPDMPRAVFKLLWNKIQSGHEIFAYVVNMSNNGAHYWVLAHVTPSYDNKGNIIGYHSNRRLPRKSAIEAIKPVYARLLAEEKRHNNPSAAIEASTQLLTDILEASNVSYDEFVFSL